MAILSSEDKAAFIALATHDKPRSVVSFGETITANDVAQIARDAGKSLIGA
jgi:hypothetical protein